MAAIAAAAELDYGSGAFCGGRTAEALIDDFHRDDPAARDRWLDEFAVAVCNVAPRRQERGGTP